MSTEPFTLIVGDALEQLRLLPDESVQCCVTSPPYWALRDYGVVGQVGLEPTPTAFVERLVMIFREVSRVLSDDGVCWVNIGDTYASASWGGGIGTSSKLNSTDAHRESMRARDKVKSRVVDGLKEKDLAGIPWALAFALRADGWWLRSEVIWEKPNAMPESVLDRPARCHEQLFLFTKSARYFYDADAIRRPLSPKTLTTYASRRRSKGTDAMGRVASHNWSQSMPERKPRLKDDGTHAGANARSVWAISTQPYEGAHFATFPEELPRRCILAGSRPGDLVIDPFAGTCTTGAVALKEGRRFVGIELSPTYAALGENRCRGVTLGLGLAGGAS